MNFLKNLDLNPKFRKIMNLEAEGGISGTLVPMGNQKFKISLEDSSVSRKIFFILIQIRPLGR